MKLKDWVRFNSDLFEEDLVTIAVEIVDQSSGDHMLSAEAESFKALGLIFDDYKIISVFPDWRGSIVITLEYKAG